MSDWFHCGRTLNQIKLKMFCFPYAGGTASVFSKWADLLPLTVQLISVELPGRGPRLKEPPYLKMSSLVDDLAGEIRPLLDKPFVFFGHSMGAIIAFELARLLRLRRGREPEALFVSGRRAPQIPNNEPVTYDLPTGEFIEELSKLDGTPREVLEHKELMEMMIPLLRADFQLIQTYNFAHDAPLRYPVTAYGGIQDQYITRDMILPWREQTSSRFALHMLPGDHFFIRSSQTQLLRILAHELREIIACPSLNNA